MGLFLESPSNFSGPESCFVSVVFAYKIKVLARRYRSVHLGVVVSRVCEDCFVSGRFPKIFKNRGWFTGVVHGPGPRRGPWTRSTEVVCIRPSVRQLSV